MVLLSSGLCMVVKGSLIGGAEVENHHSPTKNLPGLGTVLKHRTCITSFSPFPNLMRYCHYTHTLDEDTEA